MTDNPEDRVPGLILSAAREISTAEADELRRRFMESMRTVATVYEEIPPAVRVLVGRMVGVPADVVKVLLEDFIAHLAGQGVTLHGNEELSPSNLIDSFIRANS